MKIIDEALGGLKLISLDIYKDSRGYFAERYSTESFAKLGINNIFVQDNFSRSHKGVVRGLHYQTNPAQAKLVGVTRGKIFDVAVDIRKSSPTFGKHYAVELSAENSLLLFVPSGFAHGFCAVEEADVIYKVDGLYQPATEGGIAFNDPDLNIKWPLKNIQASDKDSKLQSFAQFKII